LLLDGFSRKIAVVAQFWSALHSGLISKIALKYMPLSAPEILLFGTKLRIFCSQCLIHLRPNEMVRYSTVPWQCRAPVSASQF
jgi:hypothetical protein